ncbi:MAG: hypothetical protein WC378_06505 [Opitutaceae bacterium]
MAVLAMVERHERRHDINTLGLSECEKSVQIGPISSRSAYDYAAWFDGNTAFAIAAYPDARGVDVIVVQSLEMGGPPPIRIEVSSTEIIPIMPWRIGAVHHDSLCASLELFIYGINSDAITEYSVSPRGSKA